MTFIFQICPHDEFEIFTYFHELAIIKSWISSIVFFLIIPRKYKSELIREKKEEKGKFSKIKYLLNPNWISIEMIVETNIRGKNYKHT